MRVLLCTSITYRSITIYVVFRSDKKYIVLRVREKPTSYPPARFFAAKRLDAARKRVGENTATRRLKLVTAEAEWVGYNAVLATRYVVKTV